MHDALPDDEVPPELAPREFDWPTCPQCGRRRMTACPICQTASAEFPAAEYAPAAADESPNEARQPLLMCPTCDEAFTPRYYRRCELCGHQFGGGNEADGEPAEFGGRALWLLAGMLVLGCAAAVYFWVILRP